MDSPLARMSSPTKVLNPISPERINQQTMPTSPSTPTDIFNSRRKGSRGMSDVQAKVAFLNNLSGRNSPAPGSPGHTTQSPQPQPHLSSGSTAALQRAILGREEAESSLQKTTLQLFEAQARERSTNEKLESLSEDLQAAKERQTNERSVFEKEIRKARKEAFRAGSAVVKFQEDLKEARAEVKAYKDEVQAEREAKDQAKQEAFERAYALASITEELEVLKERLRTAETNNHSNTLEARAQDMRKQDIGRLSLAEGDLALLLTPTPRRPKRSAEDFNSPPVNATNDSSTQCTPPKRPRLSDITPRQEVKDTTEPDSHHEMLEELQDMLEHEKQRRVDAEEMVDFMKMECQFKRCSCRLSEEPHSSCAQSSELPQKGIDGNSGAVHDEQDHDILQPSGTPRLRASTRISQPAMESDAPVKAGTNEEEAVITFSPETGTFRTIPSPQRPQGKPAAFESSAPQAEDDERFMANSPPARLSTQRLPDVPFEPLPQPPVPSRSHPFTPSPSAIVRDAPQGPRLSIEQSAEFEVDTSGYPITKRVPLRTEPRLSNQSAVPGTPVSREEALAQIRARRGRANSMKRSVSAGEALMRPGGTNVGPNRIPGATPSNGRGSEGNRRDLSAPIRAHRR